MCGKLIIEVVTYTSFRQNLKSLVDRMIDRCEPLYVKRGRGEDLIVMSKSDYNSMQETFYLMSSPKNAERLLAAKNSTEGVTMTLQEIKEMIDGDL